jgi:hypothetical protein
MNPLIITLAKGLGGFDWKYHLMTWIKRKIEDIPTPHFMAIFRTGTVNSHIKSNILRQVWETS